jgi:hypothetical protein
MKFIFLITAFCFLQISPKAMAGFGRGNGGDVIVCETPSPANQQILDLYELSARYGNHLWPSLNQQQTADDILRLVFQRAENYSPWLGQKLKQTYAAILSQWIMTETLPVIADTGGYSIPNACHIQQIAVQFSSSSSTTLVKKYQHQYYLDRNAYAQLSPLNQATLILHEIFWSLAIDQNLLYPSTSRDVRRKTVILLSTDAEFMDQLRLFWEHCLN